MAKQAYIGPPNGQGQTGGIPPDFFNKNTPQGDPKQGLENFSHDELMKMYSALLSGQVPQDLSTWYQNHLDANGKPLIDAEGGAIVQPNAGFVVKTKDQNGNKVFVNMTQHEFVDPFEQKAISSDEREQYGGQEQGIRIPLSLGTVREDFDKKGNPSQVYDIIWNPKTIDRCKAEPQFRQIVIELAFNYINQKFKHELSMRFTVPKMKYKGKTVEFQRIRAKKAPKIQEMEMTEEQRMKYEAQGLEDERKKRPELLEQTPDWKVYCVLEYNQAYDQYGYWQNLIQDLIKKGDEEGVGDTQDRLAQIAKDFQPQQEEDALEEYDGFNSEVAKAILFIVSVPILVRSIGINLSLTDDLMSFHVPNIYKLELGLPIKINKRKAKSFFDCKLRKLIIYLPKYEQEEELTQQEDDNEVQEIKIQDEQKSSSLQIVDTKKLDDDLLFDVV